MSSIGTGVALAMSEVVVKARMAMKWMASRAGGDTDTSRDYVYTDWADLVTFATRFAHTVDARPLAAAAGHGGL